MGQCTMPSYRRDYFYKMRRRRMVTETQLPTSKHFRLEKLAEGVYAALAIDGGGAMCNAGIVDLGDRALVFDTFWTPEASLDLLTAAEQLTGHAVVYIVNSHYNADHVNGNQVFAPATTIISTSRTRELLIERGNGFLNWAREHLAEEVHEDEKKLAAETNEDRRQQMALDLETTRALLHALPTLDLRLHYSGTFKESHFPRNIPRIGKLRVIRVNPRTQRVWHDLDE